MHQKLFRQSSVFVDAINQRLRRALTTDSDVSPEDDIAIDHKDLSGI